MDLLRAYFELHEAELTHDDIRELLRAALQQAVEDVQNRWCYVRAVSDTWVVFEDYGSGSPKNGALYQVDWTLNPDETAVTLSWPAVEVVEQRTFVPVDPANVLTDPATGQPVPTITASEAGHPLEGDTIALAEAAVRPDGTVPIKIISEGWGSSGYYPAAVIARDGPTAFPAGTHMYWDHPTVSETQERPERSLRDLSAVLESDAHWQDNGAAGPGLYATARLVEEYRPFVDQLAADIGVSIRALGKGHVGEADGRRGLIIDEIVEGKSIDFVTQPGRGGKVLALFESARGQNRPTNTSNPPEGEPTMSDTELREANQKLATDLTEATGLGAIAAAERDAARAELARLREAAALSDARAHASTLIDQAAGLHAVTKARLIEEAVAAATLTDGALDKDTLTATVTEAVKAAQAELAAYTKTGSVTGLGLGAAGAASQVGADTARLVGAFERLGLSEAAAKTAASGRV